jgi:flavocytochrome c
MTILPADGVAFEAEAPLAIVGAGACGLVAALAAREAGAAPLVIERDPVPAGSTALSSGMIPACETEAQRVRGIADSVTLMEGDILAKAKNATDAAMVATLCRESGPAIDWLVARHGIDLTLVEGFLYPGHSVARMHAPPSRTGAALIGSLTAAAERAGIDLLTSATVRSLYSDRSGRVHGIALARPDGTQERIGCRALILACNGFGGNPQMVRRYIPEMADAIYCGHPGNRGDALEWGVALGGEARDMGAFQGHGSVAHPHNILITWALMSEGGIQVNTAGERFSNEHAGYSEQARIVRAQPGSVAWAVHDARLHALGLEFEEYRQAQAAGAVIEAADVAALAARCGLPAAALTATMAATRRLAAGAGSDRFGRDFTARPSLTPPFFAIRVTGALFHTQGGLAVDTTARVRRRGGGVLPNLFAGGGAARGLSGPADDGYLSGNGLLSAVTLGRIGGRMAAAMLGAEGGMFPRPIG